MPPVRAGTRFFDSESLLRYRFVVGGDGHSVTLEERQLDRDGVTVYARLDSADK